MFISSPSIDRLCEIAYLQDSVLAGFVASTADEDVLLEVALDDLCDALEREISQEPKHVNPVQLNIDTGRLPYGDAWVAAHKEWNRLYDVAWTEAHRENNQRVAIAFCDANEPDWHSYEHLQSVDVPVVIDRTPESVRPWYFVDGKIQYRNDRAIMLAWWAEFTQ